MALELTSTEVAQNDHKIEAPPAQVARSDEELFLKPKQTTLLVAYNIVLAILFAAALILLVIQQNLSALLATLTTAMVAGTLGGTLCNLRGLFTHIQEKGGRFPIRLKIPFYIRPLTGAVTGLFTFFVGNLLVTSLAVDAATRGWKSLEGRLPYIALAILAGFAAQEFMERLKALARTLFSERASEDLYSELEKLSALYKDGVIDEDEFKDEKEKVLKAR